MSPETITRVMREMGLNIPSEVVLARDAAQAIASGSAAVESLKTAKDASEFREAIQMSANSVRMVTSLASRMNWISAENAMFLSMGVDVACIIGSGGTDVGAWVRLAMTIGQFSVMAQAKADMQAKKSLIAEVSSAQKRQIQNFSDSIKELERGEIGIFGFLVKNAGGSPLLFNALIPENPAFAGLVNFIPGLKFLPQGPWTFEGKGASTTWWGESKKSSEKITLQGLAVRKPADAVDFLLNNLIWPNANLYMSARAQYLAQGRADIFNVALFALFEENFRLTTNMNLMPLLVQYQLSPHDIGEDNIFSALASSNKAITTNFGVSKSESLLTTAEMQTMDLTGNIERLRDDRQAHQQIMSRFSFGPVDNEGTTLSNGFDWRLMSNFISVLDFLDLVYSDPAYETFKRDSKTLDRYDFFPKLYDFKTRFEIAWKKSVIRRVNVASRANIAYFLGAPISQIEEFPTYGDATVFKTK